VVEKVRDQEQTRADHRADHASTVSGDAPSSNKKEPDRYKNPTRGIQDRVERWQEAD
jgi:hypothetical protein